MLSKLSVNSSSCNLVKNLVKSSEISNQLSNNVNLINQDINLITSNNEIQKFDNYINESGDWISKIEFVLDINVTNSNLNKMVSTTQ